MNTGRPSHLSSKFVTIYTKLFQGLTPEQISPHEDPAHFYSDLLGLDINREFLEGELNRISKDACTGSLKSVLNGLFSSCLGEARQGAPSDNDRKSNAIQTLAIIVRYILKKNPSGWEVMEIFAGGVSQSDSVFMNLTSLIDDTMGDPSVPASIRHQVLQFALIYICGIAQLSPGAYLLRRDLFPSIVSFIKSPDTEQYTFEAVLFLAVLANFHKSDAANLNPYLLRIRETRDKDLMRKICWASNFALCAAVKSYQEISNDDSSPTLTSTLGSIFASWRPDRALASTPVDPPRELFKHQPIEASVVLLPMYEFIRANSTFSSVLVEYISSDPERKPNSTSPPLTILTLSSYILTHATSLSSPRSIAYANLCMNCLLALVEEDEVMVTFREPVPEYIRLCRQRLPLMPVPPSGRPPLSALLDCCILFLRHNLHKRLEVNLYTNCIWICYRVIWYLQQYRIRLDYDWKELWTAVLGLLSFLSTKFDDLTTTGGVEQLLKETILLLNLSLSKSEIYLPTPRSLHEFIYELVRSASILQTQVVVLKRLSVPQPELYRRNSLGAEQPSDILNRIVTTTQFYEQKVAHANARTAKDAMRVVAREIEADGLYGVKEAREMEPPKRSEDMLGFSRFACMDGLGLMP